MKGDTASRVTPLREYEPPDIPPESTTAEQGLIGAIFLNNAAYSRVSDFLRVEHFSNGVHGRIYSAIGSQIGRGLVASPVSLKNYFDHDGALAQIGGAEYLARLAASAVTVINAESYARAIVEAYQRRLMLALSEDIAAMALHPEPGKPVSSIVEALADQLDEIASAGASEGAQARGPQPAGVGAAESLRRSEAAYKGEKTGAGVPSGLADLDRRIAGGFQGGDLIIIGARPAMGKSSMCATLLFAAAERGIRSLLFSLEMPREQVERRMLAALTYIPAGRQRQGDLTSKDFDRLIAAQEDLSRMPIMIDDTARLSAPLLRQRARFVKQRGGLGLIVVDYLQLGQSGGARDRSGLQSGYENVVGFSAALTDLAKDLDVPVVAMSQLSREVERREDKRPLMSDLRNAGEIEQDAAVVIFIYRDEVYLAQAEPKQGPHQDALKADRLHAEWSMALENSRNRADLIISKSRDGIAGTARVAFDGARGLFTDLQYEQGGLL